VLYTRRVPRVWPFRGLRYDVAVAGPLDRLTAPPYDVISDPWRSRLVADSPLNVVRADLADGHADPTVDGNRYDAAAALLSEWRERGVLRLEDAPSYYGYEMAFDADGRRQRTRGVLVAMDLEPWGGDVLPHEDTMQGPIDDRLCLLRATRTHLSAVYTTAAGPFEPLRALLDETVRSHADAVVTDEEDVRHRLWRLPGGLPIDRWLRDRRLLIADGHHRYTTALAFRDERRATSGPGPWDRILTLVVDAASERVHVLPYHRLQLVGEPPRHRGEARPSLAETLAALDDDRPTYGTVVLDAGAPRFETHRLASGPPAVRALHDEVLDLAVPTDAVRFTHRADDVVAAVADGSAVAGYLLPPTTPKRIMAVAATGARLPRKSTFFWPKPRTGMLMMPLTDPEPSQ
jgi:uncharacterized protein (DUF1015 family)